MHYSMSPLSTIDTINSHVGFYFFVAFCLIWLMSVIFNDDRSDGEFSAVFIICSIILGIIGYISYNTGDYHEFANKKVTAKLVGFVAEGYSESQGSGKNRKQVDVHKTYVSYEVNEQYVLFPANLNITYPKTAILYENENSKLISEQ